jgi:hypothetical protein
MYIGWSPHLGKLNILDREVLRIVPMILLIAFDPLGSVTVTIERLSEGTQT